MAQTEAPVIRHETTHDLSAIDEMINKLRPQPIAVPYTPAWVKWLIGGLTATLAVTVLVLVFRPPTVVERPAPAPSIVQIPVPYAAPGGPATTASASDAATANAFMPPAGVRAEVARAEETRAAEGGKIVSNYVIFHQAPFSGGMIFTGWRYPDNNATEPNSQWCYYDRQDGSGTGRTVWFGRPNTGKAWADLGLPASLQEAESKCVWFKGRKPTFSQSDPT